MKYFILTKLLSYKFLKTILYILPFQSDNISKLWGLWKPHHLHIP